jgi:predicted  nucleic acid-binding Zn-ribbon protein
MSNTEPYQQLVSEIATLQTQRRALVDQIKQIDRQLGHKQVLLDATNKMLASPELINNMKTMIQAIENE